MVVLANASTHPAISLAFKFSMLDCFEVPCSIGKGSRMVQPSQTQSSAKSARSTYAVVRIMSSSAYRQPNKGLDGETRRK